MASIERAGAVDLGKLKADQEELAAAQLDYYRQAIALQTLTVQHFIDQGKVLAELANAVHGVRYALMPSMDKFHVPAIVPVNPQRPDHRWRVYCLACSEMEGAFVYPCQIGGVQDVAMQPSVDVMHIPASMRHNREPLLKYLEADETPTEEPAQGTNLGVVDESGESGPES